MEPRKRKKQDIYFKEARRKLRQRAGEKRESEKKNENKSESTQNTVLFRVTLTLTRDGVTS